MKIEISRTPNFVFFCLVLPILSTAIGLGLNTLLNKIFESIQIFDSVLMTTLIGGPSTLAVYGFCIWWFDNFAFQWQVFRFFRIVDFPLIAGEWRGSLINDKQHSVNDLQFSIKQRFSAFNVVGRFDLSDSCSTSSLVAYNQDMQRWEFLFQYRNTPNTKGVSTGLHIHNGLSVLYYQDDKLLCDYYNDQFRGNSGTITLSRIED